MSNVNSITTEWQNGVFMPRSVIDSGEAPAETKIESEVSEVGQIVSNPEKVVADAMKAWGSVRQQLPA